MKGSPVSPHKLPLTVKLGYGVCDLGGNLFFTVIAFLLLNWSFLPHWIAPKPWGRGRWTWP